MGLFIQIFFTAAFCVIFASATSSGSGSSSCTDDGVTCRLVVSSNQIYALSPDNFDSSSNSAVVMRFDYLDDPAFNNSIDYWIGGLDTFGLSAFDYTRPTGCLGCNGPLGYAGPLGSTGNIPNRFHGHTSESKKRTYANNWCDAAPNQNDTDCVYGSAGPLGEAGPLNPFSYYFTMYHLGTGVNWSQNYNINLDSAGIWGTQGPLGVTGALGVLGPLGPLSISLQPGVTTLATGQYKYRDVEIRQTSPVRYTANASTYRAYDLFEMYTRDFAQKMGMDNDCSFGVDSYMKNPAASGDSYLFTSNATQFLSINVVPVNLLDDFGVILAVSQNGGQTFSVVANASTNPYASEGGIMDFIVTRARPGEVFRAVVFQQANGAPTESGYYLYVTGSGLIEIDASTEASQTVDVWGPRLQKSGANAFNINGAHQVWVPW